MSYSTFVAERLVRYKVPRTVEIVSDSLRDDAGKVRRSALRAERLEAIVEPANGQAGRHGYRVSDR